MKTTDKNEKGINVLPFAVVQKAVEGDIVSINKVMKHYEGSVICLSIQKLKVLWQQNHAWRICICGYFRRQT